MNNLLFKIKNFLAICYNNFIGGGCYLKYINSSFDINAQKIMFVKCKFKLFDNVKLIRKDNYDIIISFINRELGIKNDFTPCDIYEIPIAGTISHIAKRFGEIYYVVRVRHNKYVFVEESNLKKIKYRKLTKHQKRSRRKTINEYIMQDL